MKKVCFAFFIQLSVLSVVAQVQTQIIGDSVRIHSNTGTGELILQNATQNVNGFLFNKSNGTTEFRKGLIKINDTSYQIVSDTLRLNSGINNKNVFFVSRKFIGVAKAYISGATLASVSSTNSSYISQLASAKPGSNIYTYPDPFSARNAALDSLQAGAITNAAIVVIDGNRYTIGFTDSSKNGSIDGNFPNNGTVADIQFNQNALNNNNSISSIMQNNVDTYFGVGTAITFINSGEAIYCYYNSGNTVFKSGIYGQGSFYQVYGEKNYPSAKFSLIANPLSSTVFNANEVVIQQWQGFSYSNFSNASIGINDLKSADAIVFNIGKLPSSNFTRSLDVKVNNCRVGGTQIPYPSSNDYWYFVAIDSIQAANKVLINISIDNLFLSSSDADALFYLADAASINNLNFVFNINNFVQRDSHIISGGSTGLIGWLTTRLCTNNNISFNITNADVDAPLLGNAMMDWEGNKNNLINLNVADLHKNPSSLDKPIFVLNTIYPHSGEPVSYNINGSYKSYDSAGLIVIPALNGQNGSLTSHYHFSGRYESAVAGQPVISIFGTSAKVIGFTNALLLNDAVTKSISANQLNTPVYIQNVHANGPVDTNIIQTGDLIKVVPDILSFIK